MRKPSKATLRNKADKLLQDYIKTKHSSELCWLCGNVPMTVGHHFVYKSQANATRFYLPNIIPLCGSCHFDIHCHPSMNNAKITLKMGQAWYDDLEVRKHEGQKFSKEWVEGVLDYLQNLQEELIRGR